jgi:dienelactone hydrolase
MIAPLFHAWERRLASVTTNRVVRPFEWGLDWISPNGHTSGPLEHLRGWVDEAMRDTSAFFDAPPTRDYALEPEAPGRQRRGEEGTLRFPSALTTPHPDNNIVHARWFPPSPRSGHDATRQGSAGWAVRVGGPPRRTSPTGPHGANRRAVVLLPQWNADAEGHIALARVLAGIGIGALRMSLPYHDARMPPELERADYIVSANLARTIQVCRQAVLDARRAIAWLALQGYERIGILGTSLGSCLAMLTAAHEPRIRAQALNHVSPWFADVVWRGLSTAHVRAGLDGHIDLEQLRDVWRPISPFSYLDRVRDVETLLVYARYDLSFPVDLSRSLVQEFRRRALPHQIAVLPCGHYSTGAAPFKYIDGYVLTRFLMRNL